MLGDAKLNSLDTRLEQFKLSNANSQQELQTLLKEYSQLLEDYKTLKSYKLPEQTKANSVSSASTPVIEKPRNPYVLVLVDGNGYVFNDELVKDKEEGGMRAARMLNEVVEKFLREHPQAKDSRVMVRIYADVTNLSKQLAKTKLIGLEKRSIMPFAAGFTRAMGHFDFVDALDEEGTRFKIRESFKAAAEDTTCNHILFAACHDFYQLGLTIAQFPTIFRWSELVQAPSMTKGPSIARTTSSNKVPTPAISKLSALDRDDWRHNSVSADGISYDSNGVICGIPDFTSDTFPASKEAKNTKTKSCRYFQKADAHNADPKLSSMVPAVASEGALEDLLGVVTDGTFEGAW
ncbi:hypothetical protein SLS60_010244 [Paraconiothyrium brasiliense]|uniref:DUF7923 domain-containing protein n=1 Tax=Paraconiothyrium brasiliense TaxID=300254 RepID=A0ABR3QQQ3_9PLEO